MFRRLTILMISAALAANAHGAPADAAIPLWDRPAPGAPGDKPADIPSITPYFPDPAKATGAALLICPGGGYVHLAPHEGAVYAQFFNDAGIAAFVLTYRLGSSGYHYPAMFLDAARAMRMIRARAGEWKLDPHRMGVVGSSAGGHLASLLLTHFDTGKPGDADAIERESDRPDLGILCYPVIEMTGSNSHMGSKAALLGPNPSPGLAEYLSSEKQVTAGTPPCFLFATWEDRTVPVENTLDFAAALRAHGVPFDLHIYQHGGHGMGLGTRVYPGNLHPWTSDCLYWLKQQGFAK